MWDRVARAFLSPNVRAISRHCCARCRYSYALLATIPASRRAVTDSTRSEGGSFLTRRGQRAGLREPFHHRFRFGNASPRQRSLITPAASSWRTQQSQPQGHQSHRMVAASDSPSLAVCKCDRHCVRHLTQDCVASGASCAWRSYSANLRGDRNGQESNGLRE
jgi:hypothetical protein